MARDYMNIGSSPAEEDCAQVGSPDYERRARTECARFIELIRKTLGPEPEGAHLATKSFPHDFGTYHEVVCYFDDSNEEAEDYAYRCESEAPARWDTNGLQPAEPPAVFTVGALLQHKKPARVCDSCLEAAVENGVHDRFSQELVMEELGADLADHLCDQVEARDLGIKCACACRKH